MMKMLKSLKSSLNPRLNSSFEIQSESKNDLLIDNLCEVENSANELDDCVGDLAIQPESKNQLPENQNDDEDSEKLEIQSESKNDLLIENQSEVEKSCYDLDDNVENPEKLLEVGRGPNDLLDNLENTKLKSEEEEKGEELASSLNDDVLSHIQEMGGVVKVDIYEVDTKIELKVDTFLLGL